MIEIELETRETKALLARLRSRVKDLEPPLTGFGNWFEGETRKQFQQGKDPDGKPWAKLAPSTLAEKRRLGFPSDILIRTGTMRDSIFVLADARSLLIAVESPYAAFHQEGTKWMPQRRILGLNRKRRDKLAKLIRVYVVGGRRR